ncbi:cytochrome c553 [Streptacidiphilus sp. BW17]|uniref:hypothetical protein n=1 Tax=Streptacidiphilus sp. BW17 TaxID=3156274 RepID=UPI0035134669
MHRLITQLEAGDVLLIGPFGTDQPAERLVRPRRRLRAGLDQGTTLILGVLLGLTLPRVEGRPRVSASRTVEVLGVVGIAVLSVSSVFFSLLFLVVQWVAANFSPWLALSRADPLVWRAFAFVIGVLAFAISAILTIGTRSRIRSRRSASSPASGCARCHRR